MVCTDGGVICVPKYSRSGEALCFPKTIKCDGTVDCEDGSDEDLATCAQKNTCKYATLVIGYTSKELPIGCRILTN